MCVKLAVQPLLQNPLGSSEQVNSAFSEARCERAPQSRLPTAPSGIQHQSQAHPGAPLPRTKLPGPCSHLGSSRQPDLHVGQ